MLAGTCGNCSQGRLARLLKMKKWLMVVRAPFLFLAVILAFLGASIAWYKARESAIAFNIGYALLAGFRTKKRPITSLFLLTNPSSCLLIRTDVVCLICSLTFRADRALCLGSLICKRGGCSAVSLNKLFIKQAQVR